MRFFTSLNDVMGKCIYCLDVGKFGKEHVIPRFLGSFNNINNLTLGCVCNTCNSTIFKKIEEQFKEDSLEGIHAQMLNFSKSGSARIRNENVNLSYNVGYGDDFFNDSFPFLKFQNNELVIDMIPQIKINNYWGDGGYQVFQINALKKIIDESTNSNTKRNKFEETKDRINRATKDKKISIFAEGINSSDKNPLIDAVEILKKFGVNYKEIQTAVIPNIKNINQIFEVSMEVKTSRETARFISKVAMNYFSYCSEREGLQYILFDDTFKDIKEFILDNPGSKETKEIVEISRDPILFAEKETGKRLLAYTIVFYIDDNCIYSKVCLLGGPTYKIKLGIALENLNKNNFGCGHMFFPLDHYIHALTQQEGVEIPDLKMSQTFGLFKRI